MSRIRTVVIVVLAALFLGLAFQLGAIVGEVRREQKDAAERLQASNKKGGRPPRSASMSINDMMDGDGSAVVASDDQKGMAVVADVAREVDSSADAAPVSAPPHKTSVPSEDDGRNGERDGGAPSDSPRRRRVSRRPPPRAKKGGRDGPDDSHNGVFEDPEDFMYHAWNRTIPSSSSFSAGSENKPHRHHDVDDPYHYNEHQCHGTKPRSDCVDTDAVEWFRRHVLLGIVSGREGAFRVEVSQCSWLSHFPPENVFVFSDRVPLDGMDRTPHTWVEGQLPKGVWEKNGDLFSAFIPEGYVRQVRQAGQGYSAGWIEAQFRFVQALDHLMMINDLQKSGKLGTLAREGQHEGGANTSGYGMLGMHSSDHFDKNAARRAKGAQQHVDYKWFMVVDDDTIVNINHLVKRLKQFHNADIPWYLSREGWGGAGHAYNLLALNKLKAVLPKCLESFMLKSFRASDAMLLKCAGVARLTSQKEQTMSHCPASNLGPRGMTSTTQVTFHGKKDFYPPILLTSWRVYLYYVASYCTDQHAGELAAEWSACSFGNCKRKGCTKEKNAAMKKEWLALTDGGTAKTVPLHLLSRS